MRPVEGAMKLLRACFSSFQCIFCLAKHDDRYFSWNFNAALRYVPSMLWNISEISEIFWKVLWAGQTSGILGHGYFGLDAAIHGGWDLASLSDGLQFVQGFTIYCSIYDCSSPFINLGPPRLLMFTVTRWKMSGLVGLYWILMSSRGS